MRNHLKIYLIAFTVVISLACKNQDQLNNQMIKYGTSFGMCVGYCNQELTIIGSQATLQVRENGNNPKHQACQLQLTEAALKSITNNSTVAAINKLPEVIGCPDCADGGAEYVEIQTNGKTKRVTFEYGKAPAQLQELIKHLKPVLISLNECK